MNYETIKSGSGGWAVTIIVGTGWYIDIENGVSVNKFIQWAALILMENSDRILWCQWDTEVVERALGFKSMHPSANLRDGLEHNLIFLMPLIIYVSIYLEPTISIVITQGPITQP